MLMYPHINPIALQIGPVAVHWYGVTYLAAFALFYFLGSLRLRHEPFRSITVPGAWTRTDLEDILFLGVVGVIGSMVWFARSRRRPFWQVMDFVSPCVPTGLAAGRVGNFINGELWGRFSSPDLPWGMVFPQSGSMLPRHPSQVYQFLLEGLLLFVLLWLYARKERRERRVSAVFLIGYGVFRFTAEFFREPDDFLGLLALIMSMGQWLCVPMVVFGVWLYLSAPGPRRSSTAAA